MKKQILLISALILVLLLLISVLKKTESDIENRCEFDVHRFEQDFFNMSLDSFDTEFIKIKNAYPSFFNDTTIDFKEDVFF